MAEPSDKPKNELKLLAWRVVRKEKLRGFAKVELPIGLQIPDVPIFQDGAKVWAGLPQKPMVRAGRQLHDQWGKPAWQSVLSWRDRTLSDRWGERVGELVRRTYARDFNGDDGGDDAETDPVC